MAQTTFSVVIQSLVLIVEGRSLKFNFLWRPSEDLWITLGRIVTTQGRSITPTKQWRYLNLTRNSFYYTSYFLRKVSWVWANHS